MPSTNTFQKFRKRTVVIEAVQLTWENWGKVCDFIPRPWFIKGVWIDSDGKISDKPIIYEEHENSNLGLLIKTLESQEFLARGNDWIIKGVNGEFYACKSDIFEKTYEAA